MTALARRQAHPADASMARRDATGRLVVAATTARRIASAPSVPARPAPAAPLASSASPAPGATRPRPAWVAALVGRAGPGTALGAAFARVSRGRPSRRLVGLNLALLAGVALVSALAAPSFAARGSDPAANPGSTPAGALAAAIASPAPGLLGAVASLAPAGNASSPAASSLALPATPDGGLDLFDLGTKTAVVAGLLYVTLRVLRRMQNGARGAAGDGIAVLETRSIAPKASVHVVSVRGRELVIGLSPAGLVTLADLGDARHTPVSAPESRGAAGLPARIASRGGVDLQARIASRGGVDLPSRIAPRVRGRPA